MNYEKSCGAVVFTKVNREIRYLLVSSLNGFYGFPKGHMEIGETEIETALREIYEETNLKVNLIEGFRVADEYPLPQAKDTIKQVVYYLASFEKQEVVYQKEELSGAFLVSYKEAMELLQFNGLRRILTDANNYLRNTNMF